MDSQTDELRHVGLGDDMAVRLHAKRAPVDSASSQALASHAAHSQNRLKGIDVGPRTGLKCYKV
jgi:hypothetical protein